MSQFLTNINTVGVQCEIVKWALNDTQKGHLVAAKGNGLFAKLGQVQGPRLFLETNNQKN
jgi:hypothetical protein